MTNNEIGELLCNTRLHHMTAPGVTRLVEERRRLLEALRPIAGEAFLKQRPGWEPEHTNAVRAIAFAEEMAT